MATPSIGNPAQKLSFTYVANFINDAAADVSAVDANQLAQIRDFLKANKTKLVQSLVFTSSKHAAVASDDNKLRSVMADLLQINIDDDPSFAHSKDPSHAAQFFISERSARLHIMYTLLANPDIDHDTYSFLINDKFSIAEKLISLISSIIENYDTAAATALEKSHFDDQDTYTIISLVQLKNFSDLKCVLQILQILNLIILNTKVPVNIVKQWFLKYQNQFVEFARCMYSPDKTIGTSSLQFYKFQNFQDLSYLSETLVSRLSSLLTITTILMLGLNTSIAQFDLQSPLYMDPKTFQTVNAALESDITTSIVNEDPIFHPMIHYSWSFILYYRLALQSSESLNDSDITKFAQFAESHNVFQELVTLSEILLFDPIYTIIITTFLEFSLNFIPITAYTSQVFAKVISKAPRQFIENFLTNDTFEDKLCIIKAKLPLLKESLIPLVNLSLVDTEFANFELKDINSFAISKSSLSDLDYDLIADITTSSSSSSDIIVPDLIELKSNFLVVPPLERENSNCLMSIPKSTKAKILTIKQQQQQQQLQQNGEQAHTTTNLIIFLYKYNGWSLAGRILQNLLHSYMEKGTQLDDLQHELMISLIKLISNVVGPKTPIEKSNKILSYLSNSLDTSTITINGASIIQVVFEIFETSLQRKDYSLIVQCCEFMTMLTPNYLHLVSSYLNKSELLDKYGKTGLSNTILGSIELSTGDYTFTVQLLKLTKIFIQESICLQNSHISKRTKIDIINKLILHAVHIFESYYNWKFNNFLQKFEIAFHLTSIFYDVLHDVFTINPFQKDQLITFSPANKLLQVFLTPMDSIDLAPNTLMNILISPLDITTKILGDKILGNLYSKLMNNSFKLCKLLISIRGSNHDLKPSNLEKLLFINSSKLVDVYTLPSCFFFKAQIIQLLSYLVEAPWSDDYPFLLSFLGEIKSRTFLEEVLFDLNTPVQNWDLLQNLYIFFTTLLESKQDGLSILFLTGQFASNNNNNDKSSIDKSNSILTALQKHSLLLDSMPEEVSCKLLETITYVLNTWTNSKDFIKDPKFVDSLLNKLKDSKTLFQKKENLTFDETISSIKKYKLVSRIVEIFALYIYNSNDSNAKILKFLNQEDLFESVHHFFQIDGFNKTFHHELNQKFKKQWPSLELQSFQKIPLSKINESENFGYDIRLLDVILKNDRDWNEPNTNQTNFKKEVADASLNLQYVNYEISTAKAWGALITTFVKRNPNPPNDSFIDLVAHFLQLNIDFGSDKQMFTQIYLERIELSFYILYSFKLSGKSMNETRIIELFSKIFTIFKSDEIDLIKNIGGSLKNNFYRPLLRSVLILFELVTSGDHFIELLSDQLLEFFELVFSKGVYLILSEILCQINKCSTKGLNADHATQIVNLEENTQDLLLLLSLFKKITNLNPSKSFKVILASSLNEVGTVKVILNLYSSAHLIKINDEPILGQITLTFISELCSIEQIAAKFINSGLYTVLLESPLSVAIQQGNVKPEFSPRLHNVWSNGLLSIILLLLSQFGTKVLPETCLFVSYFGKQIKSTIYNWADNKLAVSSSLIKETNQLVLLQKMLKLLNYEELFAQCRTSDDKEKRVELVIGLDSDHDKKKLSAALSKFLTHPKYLNSRIIPTTLEEQRLLEDEPKRLEFVKGISRDIKALQESLFKDA
ncbi:nup188p [Saccharomyces arboricola H-6]|uniref:Nucleoporin NUP188 n=1 Tax=Saccharomyces arboricola (strain H-6 / AS 2.3317 / CBS 10644) TaxID=1160507 RepID=J8Q4F6_SACAR|nr:nup188p [Saccharomyces arboricola H-6]